MLQLLQTIDWTASHCSWSEGFVESSCRRSVPTILYPCAPSLVQLPTLTPRASTSITITAKERSYRSRQSLVLATYYDHGSVISSLSSIPFLCTKISLPLATGRTACTWAAPAACWPETCSILTSTQLHCFLEHNVNCTLIFLL